jgi:N utilization substance protein B
VTLNEYLELAKEYSTPKVVFFINGILDNLVKELEISKKIKQNRSRFNVTLIKKKIKK